MWMLILSTMIGFMTCPKSKRLSKTLSICYTNRPKRGPMESFWGRERRTLTDRMGITLGRLLVRCSTSLRVLPRESRSSIFVQSRSKSLRMAVIGASLEFGPKIDGSGTLSILLARWLEPQWLASTILWDQMLSSIVLIRPVSHHCSVARSTLQSCST